MVDDELIELNQFQISAYQEGKRLGVPYITVLQQAKATEK